MEEKLKKLKVLLQERYDLQAVNNVLIWDQTTYMPPGGAQARGRQSALLERLSQERLVDPALLRLLEELERETESLPYDHDDAALVRASRREYELYGKIPPEFIGEFYEHASATYQEWTTARSDNDWNRLAPYLEKTLDYSRRYAEYFPGYDHIADPLVSRADYGMKAADIRRIFAELREQLVPLIEAIRQAPPVDVSCLRGHFPKESQLRFSEEIIRDLGYDFERGRMDLTHHPFTIPFSIADVRITTRVREDDFTDCLFSAIHEAGHAMQFQGIDPDYEATALAFFYTAGVSESQSRTWENLVGRSRVFWNHYYPRLQAHFPDQFGGVPLETFYRAINQVQPSLIRTDADEVTYNLHPMIRFELELALLEGSLAVKDLPEAWRESYRRDLGVVPPDDKDGVLQDAHWYSSFIGGVFQGYTLGNILSAMFYEKALEAHPEIPTEIEKGEFSTLLGWLREKIYRHGGKYPTVELVERITGKPDLDPQPLIRYFRSKYGEIYSLKPDGSKI
jgi:carboxypeptidase Taq